MKIPEQKLLPWEDKRDEKETSHDRKRNGRSKDD
jgi:hypothetical protein